MHNITGTCSVLAECSQLWCALFSVVLSSHVLGDWCAWTGFLWMLRQAHFPCRRTFLRVAHMSSNHAVQDKYAHRACLMLLVGDVIRGPTAAPCLPVLTCHSCRSVFRAHHHLPKGQRMQGACEECGGGQLGD